MAEDPNLTGPNASVDSEVTSEHVATQKIKSDDKPIGGVDLGAIDAINLSSADDARQVDSAIDRALMFKPSVMKAPAQLTPAARLQRDFTGLAPYMTMRSNVSRQLDRLLVGKDGQKVGSEVKQQAINAIIMERTVGGRLVEGNQFLEAQLGVSKNLLKFQTGVATTFMKQCLSLQYHQLYFAKDLLRLNRAFADMVENKLEAIKINTKLPDVKKTTILENIKNAVVKKGISAAGNAVVGLMRHETTEDLANHLSGMRDSATSIIRGTKIGNQLLDAAAPHLTRASDAISTVAGRLNSRIPDHLKHDVLWEKLTPFREFGADIIHKSVNEKSTEGALNAILELLKKQSLMSGMPTGGHGPITGASTAMEETLSKFHGSFVDFTKQYRDTSDRLYALTANIDNTLSQMPYMGGGGTGPAPSGGPSTRPSGGPSPTMPGPTSTTTPRDPLIGTQKHRQQKRFFYRLSPSSHFVPKQFVFTDVYRRNAVDPGNPLVSKKQLEDGTVGRSDGRDVRSLKDLNVPIFDVATGTVLISKDDLNAGLVDINNKPFAGRFGDGLLREGLTGGVGYTAGRTIRTTLQFYGAGVGFMTGGIGAAGRFLFKARDRSPYADVYLKGSVEPGKPLVTAEKFRKGLIFGDGSRVLDVSDIDQPVLDPVSGLTLITEDDIKTGIVDVWGKAISKRKARFSTVGGLLDVSKYGIKTAGGLAKPILGMYAELFKMIPKSIVGVGGFISKSIIGILSGKAPGALAKGLMGITGSITKMYAGMFGLGLKAVGGAGRALFGGIGRLLGVGGGRGGLTKKDMYELVSKRLDGIYNLLDSRLSSANARANSYADHEKKLKEDQDKLLHLREAEGDNPDGSKNTGLFGRLAGLLGMGGAAAADAEAGNSDPSNSENPADPTNSKDKSSDSHWLEKGIVGNYLLDKIPGANFIKRLPGRALRATGRYAKAGLRNGLRLAGDGAADLLTGGEVVGAGAVGAIGAGALAGAALDPLTYSPQFAEGLKALMHPIETFNLLSGRATALSQINDLRPTGENIFGKTSGMFFYANQNGTDDDLLQARYKAYGVDSSNAEPIKALEARILKTVLSAGGSLLTPTEQSLFAVSFGLKVTGPQFQYFCDWLDNRFRNCYVTYLAILKEHGNNIASSHTTISSSDVPKIISEFTGAVAYYTKTYATLIPTPAGFAAYQRAQTATANAQVLPGNQIPIKVPTPSNQNTPAPVQQPSSPSSQTPLPITPAAYMVPAAAAVPPLQSWNRPGGAGGNGVAQTQELTFTPHYTNNNIPGGSGVNGLPTNVVGDGQCVALVKQVFGLGQTATWKAGPRVVGNPNIKPRTPIATFDMDGTYGNHIDGSSHAAIYLGPSTVYPGGIRVYDQWSGHAPSARDVRPSEALPCNSANSFCIIEAASSSTGQPFQSFNGASLPGSIPGGMPQSTAVANAAARLSYTQAPGPNGAAPPNSPSRGYQPSGGNFQSFNGAPLPGGGLPAGGTAAANIAARAAYTTAPGSSPGGGSLSTGHAYYNAMYQLLYSAAQKQGVPNPAVVAQLGAAQSSLETGNGMHVPGGNYFGIKGGGGNPSTSDSTQEFVNGQMVTQNASFRSYNNPAASASDYITFLKTNSNYQGVLAATNINDAVAAQANSGYATDPNYGTKLASIIGAHPDIGTPPSGGPTQLAANMPPPPSSGQPPVQNTAYSPPPPPQISPPPSGGAPPGYPGIPQSPGYGAGPGANVVNPIREAVGIAENVQQAVADLTGRQGQNPQITPTSFEVMPHPDMIAAAQDQSQASQRSLQMLGSINKTLAGLHQHLQQVHSPDGLFGGMAENIANQGQGGNNVIAPMINMPAPPNNNQCHDDIGFSVRKKRDNRYVA